MLPEMLRVGSIGLGDMGAPIAHRVVEAGFPLTVFDLEPSAVNDLTAAGAVAASNSRELAAASDVVILCVVDDDQVRAVVDQSLVGAMTPGSVLLVVSSVRPNTIREVVASLGPGGVQVIDAPVSGSRPAAAAGTLTLMLGGDEADIARVRPVLEAFGKELFHVGGHGAGQAMKIANNIMLHMNHLVALEALRFAVSQGIEEKTLIEVVNTGSGRSWVTETWGLIDEMFHNHPQAGTPGIYEMMTKEMWNAVLLSKATQTSLPLTGVGVQVARSLLSEREVALGISPTRDER